MGFLIGFLSAVAIIVIFGLIYVIVKQRNTIRLKGYSNEYFSPSFDELDKLNKFRYQYDRERKHDLDNIVEQAKHLLEENNHFDYPKNHPIFYLIRTITMNLQTENNLNVLKQKGDRIRYDVKPKKEDSLNYTTAYFHFFEYIIRQYISINKKDFKLNDLLDIELSKTPLISRVWRDDRLLSAYANIGCDVQEKNNYLVELPKSYKLKTNDFKQDNNHESAYIYPLGFVYAYNGNHSTNAGLIKSEGILSIDKVYDLTGMYEEYEFDGTYFINNKTKEREKIPFNMGALFEIGRVMLEHPNLFPEEIKRSVSKKQWKIIIIQKEVVYNRFFFVCIHLV